MDDAEQVGVGGVAVARELVGPDAVVRGHVGNGDHPDAGLADALAGDFVRLANAERGVIRVLDGAAAGKGEDFVVRVAIERDAGLLVSDSRIVDAPSGSILWSNRLSGAADDVARLRERTAVSIAAMIDCALAGAAPFTKACAVQQVRSDKGVQLIVRHPDGGFRRFDVLTNGQGLATADGAEPATVTVQPGGIKVAVGTDRYRFPATIASHDQR